MKYIHPFRQKYRWLTGSFLAVLIIAMLGSCAKIEFTKVDNPAYVRIFNNLRYKTTIDNQDRSMSTLTMLINPKYGPDGMPIGAEKVGDFLITRLAYAPPYPSHLGNSLEVYNPEYPGKERVVAGPILNGFDLSSWAQIPSGKLHIVFYARPKSQVPFFQLEERFHKRPLIDTILDLKAEEVYTLHVLEKNFETKENGVLLREENFHKMSLADSLVYVNFYNISANGFWQADKTLKPDYINAGPNPDYYETDFMSQGIRDEMKLYYSIYDSANKVHPSHQNVFLTVLKREIEKSTVAPYFSLPLFFKDSGNIPQSSLFQHFKLLAPNYEILDESVPGWLEHQFTQHVWFTCYFNGKESPPGSRGFALNWGSWLPNMIVTTHSGIYNPKSFGTVNTIEIVNGSVHLTTVQRVYDAPIYRK